MSKSKEKLIEEALNRLKEHFESVVIVATTSGSLLKSGDTMYSDETGNHFACIGSVKCWMEASGAGGDAGSEEDDDVDADRTPK